MVSGSTGSYRARGRYRDFDGVTRQVEASGRTRGEAERRLRESLVDRSYSPTEAEIGPDTRVHVLVAAWWADFETRGASKGTLRIYRGRIDAVILPALGALRVRELTVGTVHRHLEAVRRTHGDGTAKTVRAILSGICNFAAQRDALDRNPVRDAGPARQITPKRLPRSLNVAEAKQLMALLTYDDVAIHHDIPDLVGFMLATGARIGEACALRWDHLDLETGVTEIPGTKTAAAVRSVALPGWCIEMLHARRDEPTRGVGADVSLVFPTTAGTFRDPSNVQKRLKEAFALAAAKRKRGWFRRKG
jgi:integrase